VVVLVEHQHYTMAASRLRAQGWKQRMQLVFATSSLGLYGEALEKSGVLVDLIATDQEWGDEAFEARPVFDATGLRVIPLAYLVLMKLDAARGVDQGDLTRMLGRLDESGVEAIAAIVERHSHDPQAADDVRQYASLGRLEWDPHMGSPPPG
jgi:hypothetical protein